MIPRTGGFALVLVFGLLLVAGPAPVLAQAGFFEKELGSDPAKVVEDVKLDMMSRGSHGSESGSGPAPYLKALKNLPRRVGMVSYYTVDIGNLKESSALKQTVTGWYVMRSYDVTQEGISLINEALYKVGFPAMKEAFAAHGMQLLAPDEYLDTPEKKAAYESFKLETGGKGGLTSFLNKMNKSEFKLTEPATGYRLIDLPRLNASSEKKYGLSLQGGSESVFEGLGHDLAGALGLDAVLIVYNVIQAEKKETDLIGSYAYLFGPNPVPDTGQKLYWTGHQYAGAWMKLDVPLIETEKDEAKIDFDGSAIVARALAERTAGHLEDEMAGR